MEAWFFATLHFVHGSSLGCLWVQVLEKGAQSIVLASHLGRPDGSVVARLKQRRHLVCQCLSLLIGLAPYVALWLVEESIRQHARSTVYTCQYQ